MMLDAKRTFDEVIERLAPDAATRDEILANRIYQQLSSAVAGSQEFTAIAKLFELDQEGDYDLLVLDTPPSRNALDFLDAPGRLTGFFQGRAIRMFLRPAGLGGKIIGRGTGVVFSVLKRVTGVDLLEDLSVFFRSLGGLIDGFTERAERVGALLEDPATTFLIVTSPQHDPVEEAIFFHRKLSEAGMPFGGMVVNRVHAAPETNGEVPAELVEELGEALAERVADSAHDQAALAARDEAAIDLPRGRAALAADDRRPRARGRRARHRRARTGASPSVRGRLRVGRTAVRRLRPGCSPSSEARSASGAQRRGRGGRRGRRGGSPAGASRAPRRGASSAGSDARPAIAARSSATVSRSRRARSSRSSGAAQIAARRSHSRRRHCPGSPSSARAGEQPVREGLPRRRALAAQLEPPQRPRQLARARGAAGDQGAERAQRVLLLGREQAVAVHAAQAGGERDRQPRAAVRAGPGDRGERRLGVVPQAQRGLQPAQPAAGRLERGRLAGRGLEVQHGDRRVVVAVQVGRGVEQRRCRARARGRRRAPPRRRRSRGPRPARARPTASSRRRPPPRARGRPGRSARGRRRSRWRRPTGR